jgi:FdhD protein
MARVVRILAEEGYDGVLVPDHAPEMNCPAPWHAGFAYALGYTGMGVGASRFGARVMLDKLAGVLARDRASARQGLVVLTSRISIEMVQKAAMIGTPLLVAVSAPTALAVRMADACGMTLVAIARKDGFEAFTHPQRVKGKIASHVA